MTRAILAAGFILLPLAAPAASITFDFGALADEVKGREGRELLFAEAMPDGWTVGGVTVTASPGAFLDGAWRRGARTFPASGLGLCNDPSGECNGSDWDGIRDIGERLTLTFSQPVRWLSATMRETPLGAAAENFATLDDHVLANGAIRVGTEHDALETVLVQMGEVSGLDAFGYATSWSFDPRETGLGFDGYLRSAIVEALPEPEPLAPVPLPAGAALLAGALAALGSTHRRRA